MADNDKTRVEIVTEHIEDVKEHRGEEAYNQMESRCLQDISVSAAKLVDSYTNLKSAKAPIITESISTPADVQSFTDGADGMPMALEVAVEPVQDLHGYDNPWPVGGGKNKFYCDTDKSASLNGVTCSFDASTQEFTISGTNDSSSAYVLLQITPSGDIPRNTAISGAFINAPSGVYINFAYFDGSWQVVSNGGTIPDTIDKSNIRIQVGIYGTATSITTRKFKCQIQEGSTAPTSWTPYSNICPISGWTGANVTRTGRNLFGGLVLGQAIVDAVNNANFSTFGSNTDGNYVTIKAGSAINDKQIKGILFKPNTQYTMIFRITRYETLDDKSVNIRIVYTDGTASGFYISTSSDTEVKTFVYVTISGKTVDYLKTTWGSGTAYLFYEQSGIFEGVLTETDFEAYVGNVYAYTFPSEAGTVYGGTLTIHQDGSGELVVDRANVDAGTLTWANNVTGIFSTQLVGMSTANAQKVICSIYGYGVTQFGLDKVDSYADKTINTASNDYIYIKDTSYSDAASFKSAMSGEQLVYELATPVTYQLTNQQVIELLKGSNNIWADTGKINAVDYPADTKLYIDKKLTELQALVLEN